MIVWDHPLCEFDNPEDWKPLDMLRLPDFAGIYGLYDGDHLVYIGRSGNVGLRIKTHAKEGRIEFNRAKAHEVRNSRIGGRTVLELVESYLLDIIMPVDNRAKAIMSCEEAWQRLYESSQPKEAEFCLEAHEIIDDYRLADACYFDGNGRCGMRSHVHPPPTPML